MADLESHGDVSRGKQEAYTFGKVRKSTSYTRREKNGPFKSSNPPATASATRGSNVQRGKKLVCSQAERLLISVHHTFSGRHSAF